MFRYIINNERLKHEALTKDVYKSSFKSAVIGPVCYVLAAASCFISAYLSLFFMTCALYFYIFVSGNNKMSETLIKVAKEEVRQN